jgi:uncharacterized protein
MKHCLLVALSVFLFHFMVQGQEAAPAEQKWRVLIIDGQNNHGIWPKTTAMMKDYLTQTGRFTVEVARMYYTWQGPHNDNDPGLGEQRRKKLLDSYPSVNQTIKMVDKPQTDETYAPEFSRYDVVISNFGWNAAPWPAGTERSLEQFVSRGGGLVIIHAADNSFPHWLEYNKMIGLGGWGGRDEKSGPYVYYDNAGKLIRDTATGPAGSHGKQQEILITIKEKDHPVTRGMPATWLHALDELYDRLRGPAANMAVLATAWSDPDNKGTGRHEPVMMAINYGEGRVFHSPLGHGDYSMECVGFIVMLQRACEWAVTGDVKDRTVPEDFPEAENVRQRKWDQ